MAIPEAEPGIRCIGSEEDADEGVRGGSFAGRGLNGPPLSFRQALAP